MRFKIKQLGVLGVSLLTCMAASAAPDAFQIKVPLGLVAPKIPADNPMSQAKVDLGKKLFFDESFSYNGKVACATCHIPEHGFSDVTAIG